MYRPFEKLKSFKFFFKKDENFPFPKGKEKNWEEFLKTVKPLSEKNFFWCFTPKKAYLKKEKVWPPEKLEFNWWLTSEYIEGSAPGVSKKILKELRNGRFSVKRSINLRGLDAETAEKVLKEFIRSCLFNGDNCVLIIHGRGLSSKKEPVLKNKVKEWLERGPFRKYVLAYTSARPCDGGLGATYVLLSKKPLKR